MGKLLIILLLFVASQSFAKMTIPNIQGDLCTPSDKDFKEYRYKERIPVCERDVTPKTKDYVCNRDGIRDRRDYITDHYISLFAGGSNDVSNLWCEPKSVNTAPIEAELYNKLKDGKITQSEVISQLTEIKQKIIKDLNNDR